MERTVADMWQDYLFLTREMAKFLAQKDMDLVFDLLRQREELQKNIEALHDQEFHRTEQGRNILMQAYNENECVTRRMQFAYNNAKNKQKVVNSYEFPVNFTGGHINRRT